MFSVKTGHFTQVVWNDSKKFGIAHYPSKDGSEYIVARYYPPGNFQGKFKENVKPVSVNSNNTLRMSDIPPKSVQTAPVSQSMPKTKYDDLKNEMIRLHTLARQDNTLPPFKWKDSLYLAAKDIAASTLRKQNSSVEGEARTNSDCIIIQFNGRLPTIDELFSKLYTKPIDGSNVNSSFYSHNQDINPIFNVDTINMGCAQASSSSNKNLVFVILYDPGRNVQIRFRENIISSPSG
ncbi:hypothetical protein HZS_6988 [Henneguya salminicola]|nr:hypothetical protein HZS_6988 [Henneguya salminicola]